MVPELIAQDAVVPGPLIEASAGDLGGGALRDDARDVLGARADAPRVGRTEPNGANRGSPADVEEPES